jgi:hypothetical protein
MGFGFVIYYLFNYSDEILKLITPFKVIGLAFLYSFFIVAGHIVLATAFF